MHTTVSIRQKGIIDKLVLCITFLALVMGVLAALLADPGDMVYSTAWHVLLVQLLAVYLPTRTYMRMRGGKATFGVRRVSVVELLLSFVLGVALLQIADALNTLLYGLYRVLHIDALLSTTVPHTGSGWRVAALVLLGVIVPAITDELFFRGLILHAWQQRGKRLAVLHSACLYALLACSPGTLPTSLLVGIVLGCLVVQTGSCYTSMAAQIGGGLLSIYYTYSLSQSGVRDSAVNMPASFSDVLPSVLLSLALGVVLVLVLFRSLKRIRTLRMQVEAELSADENAENGAEKKAPVLPSFQKTHEIKFLKEMFQKLETHNLLPAGKNAYPIGRAAVIATYVVLIGVNAYLVVAALVA